VTLEEAIAQSPMGVAERRIYPVRIRQVPRHAWSLYAAKIAGIPRSIKPPDGGRLVKLRRLKVHERNSTDWQPVTRIAPEEGRSK
jgi:hypothetical protein